MLRRLHTIWWGARRRPAAVLVWLQIVAIVVVGVATVARFHIFAAVDEEAHLAYVQQVAEHGRLPWLGRTVLPAQLQPHHVPGFGGLSYEAFQPPLYYALAVPAFDAASSVRQLVCVRDLERPGSVATTSNVMSAT